MFLFVFLSEVKVYSILNSVTVIKYPRQKAAQGRKGVFPLTVPGYSPSPQEREGRDEIAGRSSHVHSQEHACSLASVQLNFLHSLGTPS